MYNELRNVDTTEDYSDDMQSGHAFKLWLLGNPDAEDEAEQIGLLNLRGLSVRGLAREARLSAASLYGYISGNKRPTPENLLRLCEALHVPYSEGTKHIKPSKTGRPFKTDK